MLHGQMAMPCDPLNPFSVTVQVPRIYTQLVPPS